MNCINLLKCLQIYGIIYATTLAKEVLFMRKIISIVAIILCLTFVLCACKSKEEKAAEELTQTCVTAEATTNRTKYGNDKMKHSFILDVTDKEGKIYSYEYCTDEDTVIGAVKGIGYLEYKGEGEALEITLKFGKGAFDGISKWRIYKDCQLVTDDILTVTITDGAVYSLVPADYVPATTAAAK